MSQLIVEVGADSRWVPLSLSGDVLAESTETAREVLRIRGETNPVPDRLEHVTALLAGLSRHARSDSDEDTPLVAALALMPKADPVPLAVATLRAADPVKSLDEAVEDLVAPADERYDDPLVDRVDTPLGPAARIAQRLVDEESRVIEWLGYVWQPPDAERLLLLSVTFVDLVEAGRWSEAFDDLARLVKVWVED